MYVCHGKWYKRALVSSHRDKKEGNGDNPGCRTEERSKGDHRVVTHISPGKLNNFIHGDLYCSHRTRGVLRDGGRGSIRVSVRYDRMCVCL